MSTLLRIERGKRPQAGRNLRGRAREIGADRLPALAAVQRLEDDVRTQVEHARVDPREHHGHGAHPAILSHAHRLGGDILHLPGAPVEARDLSAVYDVGVQRIGSDIAVLLRADGTPLPERDLAVVAAAHDAGGSALLLAAVHAVGELVVGADVVELRRRLVVPRAPRRSPVHRDDGALIAGEQDDVGIVRVDPQTVVVVAPRRTPECGEGPAAVAGLPGYDVRYIQDVGVLRVHLHLVEVAVAAPEPRIRVDEAPMLAPVIGPVHTAALGGPDHRVHAPGLARRHPQADATELVLRRRQAGGDPPPGAPAIGRLVQAVVGSEGPGAADLPGRLARGPQDGEYRLGIRRVE